MKVVIIGNNVGGTFTAQNLRSLNEDIEIEVFTQEKYPYYTRSLIPQSFYPYALNTGDIETIGVKATFVTSKKVDAKIVYAITKEVFENFEDFKSLHPAYRPEMLNGLSAPIHKGALRYYKEAGLYNYIPAKLVAD